MAKSKSYRERRKARDVKVTEYLARSQRKRRRHAGIGHKRNNYHSKQYGHIPLRSRRSRRSRGSYSSASYSNSGGYSNNMFSHRPPSFSFDTAASNLSATLPVPAFIPSSYSDGYSAYSDEYTYEMTLHPIGSFSGGSFSNRSFDSLSMPYYEGPPRRSRFRGQPRRPSRRRSSRSSGRSRRDSNTSVKKQSKKKRKRARRVERGGSQAKKKKKKSKSSRSSSKNNTQSKRKRKKSRKSSKSSQKSSRRSASYRDDSFASYF